MIFCKNCGYEGAYISRLCPVCKREVEIDDGDIAEIKNMIEIAKKQKEFETVVEGYHILADFGDTDGEREWARMLEKGRDVLVIAFSSGLSGTADSFAVAARELSKKYRERKIQLRMYGL